MKQKSFYLLLLLVMFCFGDPIVQGSVTFYGSDPTLEQIDAMTDMYICFAQPKGIDGELAFPWDKDRLQTLMADAKRLGTRTILAFGGGDIVISPAVMGEEGTRRKLVSNLMDLVEEYGFDGVDNDWEPDFDGDADALVNNRCMRDNLNPFHRELRDSLDARFGAGTKRLSMSVVQDPLFYMDGVSELIYPKDLADYLDLICVMSYTQKVGKGFGDIDDMYGPDGAMTFWETWAPKEKLLPGVPFFGQADWSFCLNYHEIMKTLAEDDSVTNFVTGDFGDGEKTYGFCNVPNIREKHRLSKERGYAGIFFWDLNGDLPLDHPLSLLRALTDYEVGEKKVTQTAPLKSRIHTPVFSDTLILSDYFSIEGSTLNFSLGRELKRHSASISGDTLVITGDGVEMNSVTQVTLRITDANNMFDLQIHDFFLAVEVDKPVETTVSDNLVLSAPWETYTNIAPIVVPKDNTSLRTTTPEGDTVVRFASTIADSSLMTWSCLQIDNDSVYDLSDKKLIIEYQSDLTVNHYNLGLTIYDVNGHYHYYPLRVGPDEWLTDTLTRDSFIPGWQQPEQIDYSQIDTLLISMGSSQRYQSYCISLRTFTMEKLPTPVVQTVQLSGHYCNLSAFSTKSLQLSYRVNEPHQFTLYDMRGRELSRSTLSPQLQQLTLSHSLAKGVYIAKIDGGSLRKVWRVALK